MPCWNTSFFFPNRLVGRLAVDVHVRRLRQKIDDPYPVKLLTIVQGEGYLLSAPQSEHPKDYQGEKP